MNDSDELKRIFRWVSLSRKEYFRLNRLSRAKRLMDFLVLVNLVKPPVIN